MLRSPCGDTLIFTAKVYINMTIKKNTKSVLIPTIPIYA